MWCHCGLRLVFLVQGKPMKICLLIFTLFCVKRLWRHHWKIKYPCQRCNPQTWVVFHYNSCRWCCEASFIEFFVSSDIAKHAEFNPWYPGASVCSHLQSHRPQETFCRTWVPLLPLSSASLHPHYWPLLFSWNKHIKDVNVSRNKWTVNAQSQNHPTRGKWNWMLPHKYEEK